MRIAVVNEVSTAHRNADVIASLEGRGHEILNIGMRQADEASELTVVHTSLLSALWLAAGRADFIVGGCGTAHGYEIAVSQYPGVQCARILNPIDAWMFRQINDGNIIALALNLGYGWAGEVNLRMIFDALFAVEAGAGYPPPRRATQSESRGLVTQLSVIAHRPMAEIVALLPPRIAIPALAHPGVREGLQLDTIEDQALRASLEAWYRRIDEGALAQATA